MLKTASPPQAAARASLVPRPRSNSSCALPEDSLTLVPRPRDLILVDLDCFYVSVERVRDPSLRGRPVIVGGGPNERGVVACASYEAREYGVRAGTPLYRAARLLPREESVFLHGDHTGYMQASQRVLNVLRSFTPQLEPLSLDEAFLDMSGCERHHESWLEAAETIHRSVREETGLSVSIGIGGTRAVASVALALAKPGGVMEVRRGEEAAFLADLPLRRLPGVGERMRHALQRFNLRTIGDLATVPEAVLTETFGRTGTALSRRACERAVRALRAEDLLARSVGIRLRYADFKTVDARRRLPLPTNRDEDILAVVRMLWPERYERRVKLRLVGITLHGLEHEGERQLDLLDRLDPKHLDTAVDHIRDAHGFGAIVRGRAIGLLRSVASSKRGFRLRTPACSR